MKTPSSSSGFCLFLLTERSVMHYRKTMAPKIVNKEERKQQLAACALDVFAELGFDKASIAAIAKECGVGKGTVYEYFKSKEELFLAAVLVWMEQIQSDTQKQLHQKQSSDNSPLKQLRHYLETTADSFLSNPYYKRMSVIMTHLMISHTQWLIECEMLAKSTEGFRKFIQELIHAAAEKGELPQAVISNSEIHAINLIAGMDGIELHASITQAYLDPALQYRTFIDTYINGMH